MVHWVYIIECEDEFLYVGETTRLYRRMNEHQSGGGSINTGKHKPVCLVGLYKVADNQSFLQHKYYINNGFYDKETIRNWGKDDCNFLEVENHFTELLMRLRTKEDDDFMFNDAKWWKVRGGKYTKNMFEGTKNPISHIKDENIIDRPCCDCQYPAEVKLSKDGNCIYFVCALKNAWKDFSPGLDYAEPCDFYQVYKDDSILKKKHIETMIKLRELWCQNLPSEFDVCIQCKRVDYTMVYTHGKRRQICEPCFGNHYEELKKKYTTCLILDD